MRNAHIPYQKVTDMHLWQLCHLAMVVPIADAYYESDDPEKVEKEWKIMRKTAERLKRNFNFLRKQKGKLSPWKMNIFLFCLFNHCRSQIQSCIMPIWMFFC